MQTEAKAYYRLAMVDNDGDARYSDVVTLSSNGNDDVRVYPNPAVTSVNVVTSSSGTLRIYTAGGRLVKTQV